MKISLILFVFPIFLCGTVFGQINESKYFEVLQVIKDAPNKIQYIGNEYFFVNESDPVNKAFLIDTLGHKIELPCSFVKRKYSMDSNLIYCYQDGLIGILSTVNKAFNTPLVDSIYSINKNFYAIQQEGLFLLYNKEQKLLKKISSSQKLKKVFNTCDEKHVSFFVNNKKTILHYSGEAVEGHLCLKSNHPLPNGSFLFSLNGKTGLKLKSGEVALPAQYEHIKEWINGKYIVSIKVPNDSGSGIRSKYKTLKGIVDQEGQILLPIEYEYINSYPFGLIVRKPHCKNVVLSNSLKNVYNKEFDSIRGSTGGFIILEDSTGLYYDLVDDSKGWVLQGGISAAKVINSHALELNFENGKHILINRKGETIFNAQEEVVSFKRGNNNFIGVKNKNGTTGILDKNGKWIIEPGNYHFNFIQKLNGFSLKEKGINYNTLFNSKGKEIAKGVQFASMIHPTNAYILSKQKKVGVIDDTGEVLIPFEYEKIFEFTDLPGFYKIKNGTYSYLVKVKK